MDNYVGRFIRDEIWSSDVLCLWVNGCVDIYIYVCVWYVERSWVIEYICGFVWCKFWSKWVFCICLNVCVKKDYD